jgi:hypothetical protein
MIWPSNPVVRGTDVAAFDVEVIDVVDSEPGSDGVRILVEGRPRRAAGAVRRIRAEGTRPQVGPLTTEHLLAGAHKHGA